MMRIIPSNFGSFEGQIIQQYTLENDQGMSVKVATYGATITSITIPDANGSPIDIVCGFDTLDGYFSPAYQQNAPYFGCTVGRYASRIKSGTFSLDGQTYQLATNDGPNHLHGGLKGFDKRVWSAKVLDGKETVGVEMTLESPHLEEGYPGNVKVSVTFTLNNNNELGITYRGETDQATPLSLTNHTYFNLSGFQQTIEDHRATILSDVYLSPDETNVPVGGISPVSGSAADLRSGRLLKEAFAQLPTGFEHYYTFDQSVNELRKVAEFEDTLSGRKLEVSTTEPGMLFYTGYFTSNDLQRESGDQYGRYRAFCCETHRYPNGPNIIDAPGSVTRPGQVYESSTRFKVDW